MRFTLGVEEEYQIIDPKTRELRAHIAEILTLGRPTFGEQIKPEMMQSVVEVGTRICENITEVHEELLRLRSAIAGYARDAGLGIASAGTHPISRWEQQVITEHDRYKGLEEELQDVVRSLLIFGLHIHVGIADRDASIHVMNAARHYLPYLLALSANSPFWAGRETGLKSYRMTIWSHFPRTGIPEPFASWSDYHGFIDTLLKTGAIDDISKVWWDVRPHPYFNTLEFRVCDACTRMEETLALTALTQALVAKLYRLHERGLSMRAIRPALIDENKWRAQRYGLDGTLGDYTANTAVPIRDAVRSLLDFVDDVVDELGCRREIDHVERMLEDGTGADRQLAVYRESGHLNSVVDMLMAETVRGL